MRSKLPGMLIFAAALMIAGCGLKGPLYLPDKASNIETRSGAQSRPKDEEDTQKKVPSPPDPVAAPATPAPTTKPSR